MTTEQLNADIHIKCHCGCEFETDSIVDAAAHTDKTGHCVIINGEIKPREKQQNA
jgi:hypothetical protein